MNIVDDPLPFIRKSPERFLRQIPAQGHELATNLVGDAVLLTGAAATVCRGPGPWWIVGCEKDWLALGATAGNPCQAFQRLLPFPEAGANSVRSEVLLTAFAEVVISVGPEGRWVGLGTVDDSDPVWTRIEKRERWQRSVAFRMPVSVSAVA